MKMHASVHYGRISGFMITALLVLSAATVRSAQLSETEMKKAQSYLENNLIAPCCFRAPIADHESQVADDMKKEIAAMLASGKTVGQIEEYYVGKYGERILAVPRMEGFNSMSFVMPVFMFALGVLIILLTLRRMVTRNTQKAAVSSAGAPALKDEMDDRIESELKNL